ncbi:DNA polymerase III subunit delta' [Pseudomonas matsuisoli]|uniref:DNA polymerase III subunit delta' n=1 Tax=Pseudomonas matsuisoli TaxID=1515666 RepID=A0A917UWI7_9PSED|nr:DNA polymerase III subunit delta' [Pseudomonas matsuisoli]GGJ90542.1 DNA polymerase III subunit delta' [Pseudomonas matsuisoli]
MVECLPWHRDTWARIAGREQHAHAYLLHGPAGIGKRQFAERLVALLLCHSPMSGEPCGHCKSCSLLAAGTHPDHYIVQPEEVDKAIRVDQIRALVEFVVQTSQLGRRKVILLEPAEAMNLNAANALLKSLEEPSGDTVILMITHQLSRLLPTIKSRCVQQRCPTPNTDDAIAWLDAQLPDCSFEQCRALLALVGGSPLRAATLFQQGGLEQRSAVVEGLKKLLKQQASPSQLAESWNAIGLGLIFDWCYDWMQAVLRYQMTHDETELGADDMAKVVQYLADKSSTSKVLALQDWLLSNRQKILAKANLNRALLLEALLVQWAMLPRAR